MIVAMPSVSQQNPAYKSPGFFPREVFLCRMQQIETTTRDRRFAGAAFAELTFGVIGIALGWFFGPDARRDIPRLDDLFGIGVGLSIGIASGISLAFAMGWVRKLPLRSIQELNRFAEQNLYEIFAPFSKAQLIVLAMTAGVGEELLFRGWLQAAITGPTNSGAVIQPLLGILAASMIFGLAHPITRTYAVIAAGMGFILGSIYWLSGNLLAAIIAHAVYDAIAIFQWKSDMKHQNNIRN